MTCDGGSRHAHAQLSRLHLDAYDHLATKIAELDALVTAAATPFAALILVPAFGRRTAEVIAAETGGDMAWFASSARLVACWAGWRPDEPAGKAQSTPPPAKATRHVRAATAESPLGHRRDRSRLGSATWLAASATFTRSRPSS